jgi:hypothetical protein
MTNPTIMDSASGSAFGCTPSTSTSTSDAGPSQSRPYPFSHPALPSTRVDGENVAKGLKEVLVGSSANVYSRQDKQSVQSLFAFLHYWADEKIRICFQNL